MQIKGEGGAGRGNVRREGDRKGASLDGGGAVTRVSMQYLEGLSNNKINP